MSQRALSIKLSAVESQLSPREALRLDEGWIRGNAATTTPVAMLLRKTATGLLVLLASCQHASQENSVTPESSTSAAPPPLTRGSHPTQRPATGDGFDIDTVSAGLEPIERCSGSEVLWGDTCTSSPDVLAGLASSYSIPAALRECGPSLLACQHAHMLCALPDGTLEGDEGERVSAADLARALYEYGENGLSRKCSKRYRGGCEEFRRYPKTSPDCPRER